MTARFLRPRSCANLLAVLLGLCLTARSAAAKAAIVTFDVPDATQQEFLGTVPFGVNTAGIVTGYYNHKQRYRGYFSDTVGLHDRGFIRYPDGTVSHFDAPGAGSGAGQGTFVQWMDEDGDITGYYADTNDVYHGFLRMK